MLDRVTTSALYQAADAGYEQAARATVTRVDPLLRGRVDKQLRRAINDAIELTGPVDDHIDEAHQLRVAYLLHVGLLGEADPRDKETVGEVFGKASESAPKKAPRLWFLTPLVLLVVIGGGGLIGYQLFGPSAEQRLRRSPLGQALGDDLTNWVVALDRYRRSRDALRGVDGKLSKLNERRDKMLAGTKEALGEDGVKALTEVLERAEKIEGGGEKGNTTDDEKSLYAAAKAFNVVLADAGEPAVIDARTSRSHLQTAGDLGGVAAFREVVIVSYFVERHGALKYGGDNTEVTLGKRLDSLNVAIAGDAYDTEAIGGMLVSLDLAEATLIRSLMTPLAGDAPWELLPEKEATLMEGGAEMIDRAGEVLREELLDSAGVERDVASKIADLLAKRRDAIDKTTDLKIQRPQKLLLDNETTDRLEHFRDDNLEAFQVLELNEKLQTHEEDFKSILLLFADAATIRGVVYLLEPKDGAPPESLAKALSKLPERYRDAEHPRRQMLADLAAIAHSDKIAKTLLSLVVQTMLRSSGRFVAPGPRAVISEMAAELGVTPKDPWIVDEHISKRFPTFYKALMERSSADVQKAAAAVFKRLSEGKSVELSWK